MIKIPQRNVSNSKGGLCLIPRHSHAICLRYDLKPAVAPTTYMSEGFSQAQTLAKISAYRLIVLKCLWAYVVVPYLESRNDKVSSFLGSDFTWGFSKAAFASRCGHLFFTFKSSTGVPLDADKSSQCTPNALSRKAFARICPGAEVFPP